MSIIVFLIVLSILILVHEMGHFFAAKKSGVLVEEFGFGIPPRIFGKKYGETLYSLNLLPFGGFVKLHGETAKDEIVKADRAFINKPKKVRAIIITAGVIMNFILALFAFSLVYSFSGVPKNTGEVNVEEVNKDSPAEKAGVLPNDIVKAVDGKAVSTNEEFINLVEEKGGGEVDLTLVRGDKEVDVVLTPRENPPKGEGALGVVITDSEIYYPPLWQRPFYGVYYGVKEAVFWGGVVVLGLFKIITGLFQGNVPTDLAGPVGLYAITTEVAKVGILPLINWLGIVSVNLAILNIIPLPAFDGGHLLFIGIEKIAGRRLLPRLESWLHIVTLGLLVIFLLAITYREITLISSLGVTGYIDYLSGQSP